MVPVWSSLNLKEKGGGVGGGFEARLTGMLAREWGPLGLGAAGKVMDPFLALVPPT